MSNKLTGIIDPKAPNYTWEEVFRSTTAKAHGIDNSIIDDECRSNAIHTAKEMQKVRALFNKDPKKPRVIIVSSWYRCEKVNNLVGGSKTSDHKFARAVDFKVLDKVSGKYLPILEVNKTIVESGIPFSQLIDEYSSWTHISFRRDVNKCQVLTFRRDSKGNTIKYAGLK
jgi:zinc D-Ala-D-Ala carboxypeptidase